MPAGRGSRPASARAPCAMSGPRGWPAPAASARSRACPRADGMSMRGAPDRVRRVVRVLLIGGGDLADETLEASFTAGLVNRLIDRRLTGLWGRRAVPREDHVVVVGLGQLGLRLCLLLRRCGVGIVAVDDREEGENVGTAKELGLPVVI